MEENKIIISSLAMDLKRVALGFYGGSERTAKRFSEEALKRQSEIKLKDVRPYLRKVIKKLPTVLDQKDKVKLAEDALMYSIIFQNYALKFLN